jgi:hypothetical protein
MAYFTLNRSLLEDFPKYRLCPDDVTRVCVPMLRHCISVTFIVLLM